MPNCERVYSIDCAPNHFAVFVVDRAGKSVEAIGKPLRRDGRLFGRNPDLHRHRIFARRRNELANDVHLSFGLKRIKGPLPRRFGQRSAEPVVERHLFGCDGHLGMAAFGKPNRFAPNRHLHGAGTGREVRELNLVRPNRQVAADLLEQIGKPNTAAVRSAYIGFDLMFDFNLACLASEFGSKVGLAEHRFTQALSPTVHGQPDEELSRELRGGRRQGAG